MVPRRSSATPTTSGCSRRRSIPRPARRSATSRRRSRHVGLISAALAIEARRARTSSPAATSDRRRQRRCRHELARWLVWGFAATAVLTTLMAGSEGLGLTRMNIPHMLGTMFTPNRDRAKVYGVLFHFLNGWAFSIVYVAGVSRRAHLHLVVRRGARPRARRVRRRRRPARHCPASTRAWPASCAARPSRASSSRPASWRSTTACARRSRS